MTEMASLNLAMTAVSLFNTTLLLWLALIVLFNAERRTTGLWAATGALVLGSLFFLIHTVIVGHGYIAPTFGLRLMWRLAWLPITCLPFIWYGVVLWYSGFWDVNTGQRSVRKRHLAWFYATFAVTGIIVLVQFFTRPIPSLQQVLAGDLHAGFEIAGIPALLVIYPLVALLCVSLSIDALRHPAPAVQVLSDLARQRAHPWLMGASLVLLLVSFLVVGATAWVLTYYVRLPFSGVLPPELGLLDLLAAGLIAMATLLVGQATVTYEIFTGRTLPRHALRRTWYWAIGLSAIQSLILGSILQIRFPQIYTILLAAVVTIAFFALQSRDLFHHNDDSMNTLRPFVSSQGFVEQILSGSAEENIHTVPEQTAFITLCQDVLNTKQAVLAPAGRLALLAGEPLIYPQGSPGLATESLATLPASLGELILLLNPPLEGWAAWAVPLGSERGLSGWLLLGGRWDNDLFTKEQIEFARAAGERLIDQRAGTEMARRLVSLQRQRIGESLVLDQRTRRVLHDEVLPALHSALLSLGGQGSPEAVAALTESHRQISALLRELPGSDAVTRSISRLGLVGALQEMSRTEVERTLQDDLIFENDPQAVRALDNLPPLAAEVVYFAAREGLRNASRHAQRSDGQKTQITIRTGREHGLILTICDNGDGLSSRSRQAPGPGAQQGLALHSAMLAVLGGGLELHSEPGKTCLKIWLPEGAARWPAVQ